MVFFIDFYMIPIPGPSFWTPWELTIVDGEFLMDESDPEKIQNDLATFSDHWQLFNEFDNSFGSGLSNLLLWLLLITKSAQMDQSHEC